MTAPDERSAPGRGAQQGQGGSRHRDRGNHIGFILALQIFPLQIQHRAHLGKTGVIDQHVQAPLLALDHSHGSGNARVIVDVQRQGAHARLRQWCQAVQSPRRGVNGVPAPMKFARQGRAYAAGTAGDQNALTHGDDLVGFS